MKKEKDALKLKEAEKEEAELKDEASKVIASTEAESAAKALKKAKDSVKASATPIKAGTKSLKKTTEEEDDDDKTEKKIATKPKLSKTADTNS